MQFLRRSLIGLFLTSLTLALLVMAGYALYGAVQSRLAPAERPRMAQERVFTVNVQRVEAGVVAPVLTAFGEVRSRRTLEIRSPMSGRVVELAENFEDGARVEAGQLLVQIDTADASAAVAVAEAESTRAAAELRDAEAALLLARDDLAAAAAQARLRVTALERQQNLQGRGVGTEAAVETAELAVSSAEQAVLSRRQALAQAEARLEQAGNALELQRISLAEARRRLRDTTILADFAGVLADTTVIEGGLVSANERLAALVDPDALEVAFRLSTSQYARLLDPEGRLIPAEVTVLLDVMGTEIATPGQLVRVGATVAEGQTGRLIYARLDAPRGFRPGDFVTVRVAEPPLEDVAVLPAAAVDSAQTVLALGPEDRLEVLPVHLLRRQGNSVIVEAAAVAGREIVTERAPMLGGGIRVRPLRAGGDGGAEAAAHLPARARGEAIETVDELVALSPERRAELIALVEGNARMPQEARARIIAQLEQDHVPAGVIARLEARAGG
ncbi:efflux RND transporter periplasmic adaptor subunit [Plastorhodobacter daqingensis]|uniref:Efflux RND transporter periplasmic adaptor subunit n=1 Tax=Plastorhodobacter daqingensis TaxID=1387281 RepID=A0ABW2UN73_9RHOB